MITMNSKALLYAGGFGAAAVVYTAILIFRFDILSPFTVLFIVLGAGAGVAIAYRIKFR